MQLPTIRGLIDRRLLLNFRVEPDVVATLLPAPFRPQIVGGYAMAGICLIRLRHIRPRFLPTGLGIASENAAHRIAVEWDTPDGPATGVFIPRRDTSSRLNTLAGGRLFPGVHHYARFVVHEGNSRYGVQVQSDDHVMQLAVEGTESRAWPRDSVFQSLETASEFFACGSLGYSATNRPGVFDGLELCTREWHVEPLAIERIESSFFDDQRRFPPGSITFDSALVMRDVAHEWHSRPTIEASRFVSVRTST